MNIKTWQDTIPADRADSEWYKKTYMQAEIDELRAALLESKDVGLRLLTCRSLFSLARGEINAQRKVLEQALEALNDITSEISMKRFWREKDEKRFDEIAEEAITAIQEVLK